MLHENQVGWSGEFGRLGSLQTWKQVESSRFLSHVSGPSWGKGQNHNPYWTKESSRLNLHMMQRVCDSGEKNREGWEREALPQAYHWLPPWVTSGLKYWPQQNILLRYVTVDQPSFINFISMKMFIILYLSNVHKKHFLCTQLWGRDTWARPRHITECAA